MHILIATNAFKNSVSATEAAGAIGEGLLASLLNCTISCFPVGDGGDGTGVLIIEHSKGLTETVQVTDPLGRKIIAEYGLIDNRNTAVIEMANASGLRLLQPDEYAPLQANTYGTGELIKHVLDKGVKKIILCIGGSATVDGATGIAKALGIRFLNEDAKELDILPQQLKELYTIDLSGMDKRILNTELIVLCDVENCLLGKEGAANVFGPQKGADFSACIHLEAGLTRLQEVVYALSGNDMAIMKHGGAAGGVAAGLTAFFNAKLVNGIDAFLSLTNFEEALQKADIVITGEGSIDMQTLQGKGPYGVAKMAKQKGLPVIGLAGKIPLENHTALQEYFDILLPINNELTDLPKALKNTYTNLKRTATSVGNMISLK